MKQNINKNNFRNLWNVEEDKILKLWYGKISVIEIDKKKLIPRHTIHSIRCRAKKLGFKSNLRQIKDTFDKQFFNNPNLISCYWAGFLAADGALIKKRNKTYTLQLALAEKDFEHLKKFKKSIKYTGEIRSFKNQCKIRPDKPSPLKNYYYIRINQMHNCVDGLKTFGIIPRKTYCFPPPSINDPLLQLSYIIGYFDGDGSVSANYNSGSLCLEILSSCEQIIYWIQSFFDKYFNINSRKSKGCKPTRSKQDNAYQYKITGYRAAKIIEILRSFPVPKLDRKWNNPRIIEILEKRKLKQKDFWAKRLPIENLIFQLNSLGNPQSYSSEFFNPQPQNNSEIFPHNFDFSI